MTAISQSLTSSPKTAQSPAKRAAWRDEMLGQFLERMRERNPEPETTQARTPKAQGKGQYLDVYV
jgi:hypothetical protein